MIAVLDGDAALIAAERERLGQREQAGALPSR